MSVNKVILIGRLGKDPELKHTPKGQPVCNVSVATSESWKDKDGKKAERVEWHRLQLWGKQAEIAMKFLRKGSQAYFEGKLQSRSWDDKNGVKRYVTEILVSKLDLLEKFEPGQSSPSSDICENNDYSPGNHKALTQEYEDLPF